MRWWCVLLAISCLPILAEPLPKNIDSFLSRYCIDCHDEEMNEGKVNLDHLTVDWSKKSQRELWAKIIPMLERGKMPPEKKKKQPTKQEKQQFITWLDERLSKHSKIGGTVVHRLNHREYLASVQNVFLRPEFKLPAGFPIDGDTHHFDTEAKSLLISPTHLEMFQATARKMADYLLPPDPVLPLKPHVWNVRAEDLTTGGADFSVYDGRLRLIKRGRNMETTPTKFQAPLSGLYEVTLTLSAKLNRQQIEAICEVIGGKMTKQFVLKDERVKRFTFEVPLMSEESLRLRFSNAKFMVRQGNSDYEPYMRKFYHENQQYINALARVGKIKRAVAGWNQIKTEMLKKDFDPYKIKPGSEDFEKILVEALKSSRDLPEAISYHFFENGPWLDIHQIEIKGPLKLIEDRKSRMKKGFLKSMTDNATDEELRRFFKPYVDRAYRRTTSASEVEVYTSMVREELKRGKGIESSLHLAIRMLLLSPNFVFKSSEGQKLSHHELASRFAYFLTSKPPAAQLLNEFQKSPNSLRKLIEDQIKSKQGVDAFIEDFCNQWLDLNLLEGISVDPKLVPGNKFSPQNKISMRDEVYQHFKVLLQKNLPVTDFIDPDFIYAAKTQSDIYKVKGGKSYNQLVRLDIKRGSKIGGLLTMPGVMMATANGVDTQPVLRGVWMLENIIGMPPPPPPDDVPAVSPDVTGAVTMKEIMAKHMEQKSCASCHQDIDPIGFVFENFDPIGQWRTHYPLPNTDDRSKNKTVKLGLPVDSTGVMPDGTELNDIRDLKAYLVRYPGHFSRCLSEKILSYATGRQMNYSERKLIAKIVDDNLKNKLGFRDLFVELIDSEIFKTR